MVRCAGLFSQVLSVINRHHFAAASQGDRVGRQRETKRGMIGII
jgi:hypothetical protein